jgi:phospholipid/cholesterol/gamma-HCH transport system substrate-binding protein
MSRETAASRRVGLLVLVALALGAATIFVLGDRQNLFVRKNDYRLRFERVNGLAEGSMVQLDGVRVGTVGRIVLPRDTGEKMLEVEISVDARYEQRIRQDSQARIKTLGLLGDKYLELTSGTPQAEVIPEGGEIPAAPMTNVDRLAATGEDVVEDIRQIAHQLSSILGRVERGEGVLGQLLTDKGTGEKVSTDLEATLASIREAAEGLREKNGPLGKLLYDRRMAAKMTSSIDRLDRVLEAAESGKGALPALLSDEATKQRLDRILASLDTTSARLAKVTESLDRTDSDALAAKLLNDEEFGRRTAQELQAMLSNLRQVAEKLNKGQGSAARLLNDETLARAIEDIVIGVNDSRFLRWLIQNRKKKGQEVRDEAGATPSDEPPPAPPSDAPPPAAKPGLDGGASPR